MSVARYLRKVLEILILQKINREDRQSGFKKKNLVERVSILAVQILVRGGIEFN